MHVQVGAVASLKDNAVVGAMPRTRSGEILRKTIRGIADGTDEPVPSTIESVDVLRPVLRREGRVALDPGQTIVELSG